MSPSTAQLPPHERGEPGEEPPGGNRPDRQLDQVSIKQTALSYQLSANFDIPCILKDFWSAKIPFQPPIRSPATARKV
jgi:hypothetical protein